MLFVIAVENDWEEKKRMKVENHILMLSGWGLNAHTVKALSKLLFRYIFTN